MIALENLITLAPTEVRETLAAALAGPGYAVFPALFRSEFAAEVRREMDRLRSAGMFTAANVGKGRAAHQEPETRGDGTFWFDPLALSPAQAGLAAFVESIRGGLNEDLFLGLWDWEGHYAVYPPGTFYRRHLDRFANDSKRTVSMVFFFNPAWTPADGGALRIEPPEEGAREILPELGTAVFFRSEKIPHEVMETRRDRYSFAGWLRTRE